MAFLKHFQTNALHIEALTVQERDRINYYYYPCKYWTQLVLIKVTGQLMSRRGRQFRAKAQYLLKPFSPTGATQSVSHTIRSWSRTGT